MSLSKLIIAMILTFCSAIAEDSVVSAGMLKFPSTVEQSGGIAYQVMCIDGYKFLVVTKSVYTASVTQMRETTNTGNETLMKCKSSSESK
jgi:hypothetical protein